MKVEALPRKAGTSSPPSANSVRSIARMTTASDPGRMKRCSLAAAAVRLARSAGYRGAGTVEFLLGGVLSRFRRIGTLTLGEQTPDGVASQIEFPCIVKPALQREFTNEFGEKVFRANDRKEFLDLCRRASHHTPVARSSRP